MVGPRFEQLWRGSYGVGRLNLVCLDCGWGLEDLASGWEDIDHVKSMDRNIYQRRRIDIITSGLAIL
jgi:hypothetical protein